MFQGKRNRRESYPVSKSLQSYYYNVICSCKQRHLTSGACYRLYYVRADSLYDLSIRYLYASVVSVCREI